MTNVRKEFLQTLKFIGFSISAGVIQVGADVLCNEVFGLAPEISYLISLVLSVLWNFTLNRKFTFHAAGHVPTAMLKVAGFYLVFAPLSTWWTQVLTGPCGWNTYVVQGGTMLINFVTEYLFQRFVVFGKHQEPIRLAKPQVDYRKLRLSNLTSPQFKHLLLLLLWVGFGILFFIAENFHPATHYYPMYWGAVDNAIAFCEWFLIPYLFWFVYMVGIHAYTLFYDVKSFKKLMAFIGITYYAGAITFFLFPTVQNLRPDLANLGRENFLIDFLVGFYAFDTNTNVCPSLHVVGSVAVWAAGINCPKLQKWGWKLFFTVTTLLISASTVFMKQHSIVDVIAAIPLCAIAYVIVYGRKGKKNRTEGQ